MGADLQLMHTTLEQLDGIGFKIEAFTISFILSETIVAKTIK